MKKDAAQSSGRSRGSGTVRDMEEWTAVLDIQSRVWWVAKQTKTSVSWLVGGEAGKDVQHSWLGSVKKV